MTTGDIAVSLVQLAVERHGDIFRRQSGESDFGVDAEVELTESNSVTGHLCKCQVKGTHGFAPNSEFKTVKVKRSTYNLWARVGLPVVLFFVDVDAKEILWCFPLATTPKERAKSVSLRFPTENSLKQNYAAFKDLISFWHQAFAPSDLLWSVPYYHSKLEELYELAVRYDAPSLAEPEEHNQAVATYRFVLQLRASVGFSNDEVVPLEHWFIRSLGMWRDGFNLCRGTMAEMLAYIKSFYDEAFQRIQKRIRLAAERPEKNFLRNFIQHIDEPQGAQIIWDYWDPRCDDRVFLIEMEQKIRTRSALKYSFENQRPRI